MKQAIFFIFFLSLQPIIAQKVAIVQNSLDTIDDCKEKVDFINNWTTKNYKKQTLNSKYYNKISQELAKDEGYDLGYGVAISRLALIYQNIDKDYDNAISLYNKALEYLESDTTYVEKSIILLNRGFSYKKLGSLDQATADFLTLLKLSEKRNNPKMLVNSLNNLGLLKKKTEKYNEALNYYTRAATILKENHNYKLLYSINNNIANIYSLIENFDMALNYYKENIEILKENPNSKKLASTYHNIGSSFLIMKNYDLALEYLNLSLKLKKEHSNEISCISTYNGLGKIYFELKEHKKSLSFYDTAYKIASKKNRLQSIVSNSLGIFKNYLYFNKPDSTLKYFKIYNNTRDIIIQRTNLKQIAEIETKYETEKKEAQISLLEKENQQKKIERNSLFILFLLLLSYAVFIVRSYYRNKKHNRMLSLQNNRIGWHGELLNRKNLDLEESNQTKNKLFQIISHDLRSPLASVSGISKLIPMFIQMEKYDELEETSKDLEESVTRVLNLTDNLLSWSLNQSGRLPFKPAVISLHNTLSGIVETYQSVAQEKSIHLQLITNENMFIYADRPMFETVIRNLLNNAIKFTPVGGVIVLGAEVKEENTEIWLKDSGIGIPASILPHLFEIDSNKSHHGTQGEKGNGLGLLLCKDFIEKNRGSIHVKSIEGEGSTFTITIPSANNMATEKQAMAYN